MLTQLAGWGVEVLVRGLRRNIPPIEFPERVRCCLETLRLRKELGQPRIVHRARQHRRCGLAGGVTP